jgi:hypothetical protein
MSETAWKEKARVAFERYLDEVKAEVKPGSGLGGVEAAMLRLNAGLLGEVMESLLASEQAISPPKGRGRVAKERSAGR